MLGTKLFVSVILPTRDRPALLADCLAQLCADPYPRREIIVVDQSAADQTAAIVARAAGREATLRYIRSEPLGASHAQNVALAAARGEVVAITNDDCQPEAGWLARLAGEFEADPEVVAVFGPFLPRLTARQALAVAALTGKCRRVQRGVEEIWRLGYGGNMAFRRDALIAAGGFDDRLGPGAGRGWGCSEIDPIYRVLRRGGVAVYNPDIVVWHVQQFGLRQALRHEATYARGAGAMLAKLLRCGDPNAGRLLAQRLWPVGPGRNWAELLESMGGRNGWAVAVRALYRFYCLAVLIPQGLLDGWREPVQDTRLMLYRRSACLAGELLDAA